MKTYKLYRYEFRRNGVVHRTNWSTDRTYAHICMERHAGRFYDCGHVAGDGDSNPDGSHDGCHRNDGYLIRYVKLITEEQAEIHALRFQNRQLREALRGIVHMAETNVKHMSGRISCLVMTQKEIQRIRKANKEYWKDYTPDLKQPNDESCEG